MARTVEVEGRHMYFGVWKTTREEAFVTWNIKTAGLCPRHQYLLHDFSFPAPSSELSPFRYLVPPSLPLDTPRTTRVTVTNLRVLVGAAYVGGLRESDGNIYFHLLYCTSRGSTVHHGQPPLTSQ